MATKKELLIVLAESLDLGEKEAKTIDKFVNKHDVFGVKKERKRLKKLKEESRKVKKCNNCGHQHIVRGYDPHSGQMGWIDCPECAGIGLIITK